MFKRLAVALIATISLFGIMPSTAGAAVGNNDKAEVRDWYRETGVSSGGDTAGVNYWAGRFDSHNDYDYNCAATSTDLNDTSWDMRSFLAARGMDNKTVDQQIDWAYGVVLSRAPDSYGRGYYREYVRVYGWQSMVTSLTYSSEYLNTKIVNNNGTWDGAAAECIA